MNIPSPSELGMPEKFTAWRTNQEEALDRIMNRTKRTVVISAPTGFGKELVCASAAVMSAINFNEPTCIVTATKGLENQYQKTYESIGMVDIRGRNNYTCALKDDVNYTCAEGYNARCPYKGTHMCPSSQTEMRAACSNLVLTNFDKWTATKKFGQGFDHIKHVIFDEGHHMPEALARAMQVDLHSKEIEDTLGLTFPGGSDLDDMREWKKWSIAAKPIAEEAMIEARRKLTNTQDPKIAWVRHYTHMRNLVRRLTTIATASAKDWIVDQTEDGYQFDPIRPGRYAESALLLRVPKVTVVSATVRPKTLYMTGIGKSNFDFYEFESGFNPNRCPIYWVPTMRVEYGKDLSKLWVRADQVMARRRDVKGIIHTISYSRQEEIVNASRFGEWMILNERGEAPTQKVEQFKAAGPGYVLVSPSVGTGYDFPGDDCRFQIVLKVPFEPPSKIQKARQADDKEYVYYRAMQYLVQAFGRDMRSKDDWSQRFIFDDHFGEWFKPRYSHLAPKSFHAVYKEVNVLPAPFNL